MDLPPSAYHLQSLNQMLEFGETNSSLHNLHSVRELDADGDLLTDVCYFVGRVFERVSDRIMNLTLLTHLFSFRLNLSLFVSWHSCNRNWIDLLMRLPVPFVESWIVRSSSARLPKQELRALCSARTCSLGLSKNSSIEMFFGRPSAWYKNQRLSKSFELYTICLILKTSPKVSFSHFMHNTSKLTAYIKVYSNKSNK